MNARSQKSRDASERRDEGYLLLAVIREVVQDKMPGVTEEQLVSISSEIESRICDAYRSRINRLPKDEAPVFDGELVSFDDE